MPSDAGCVLITGAAGALDAQSPRISLRAGTRWRCWIATATRLRRWPAGFPRASCRWRPICSIPPPSLAAVEAATGRFGGIVAAVNLAGGFAMGAPVHETSAAVWQRMLDLNVNTMLHSAAAVVPVMRRARHGYIVNVGAASARAGLGEDGRIHCQQERADAAD